MIAIVILLQNGDGCDELLAACLRQVSRVRPSAFPESSEGDRKWDCFGASQHPDWPPKMRTLCLLLQLFTIRDPLEVESAKSRRFVLIPIEKLKLSRVGHDGTQMMSFLFVSVVRPFMEVS
jgi:hypothetical protein